MTLPRWIIPVIIVAMTLAGVQGSKYIRIPSAEMTVSAEKSGTESVRGVFIVDGVLCRDTAINAMNNVKAVDGVLRITAYASHNRIDVEFDPNQTDPGQIRDALEGPVFMEDSGEFLFNVYRVVEMNGRRVDESK